MVNDRPYRERLSHQDAVMELKRCSDTQFDPIIVDAFVNMFGDRGMLH
jgi:HD-GYP domain-containing protein (c-di-GMP phosphodiesterase class II)